MDAWRQGTAWPSSIVLTADDDQLDRFGSIVPTSTCAEYFKSALLLALAVGSLGSSTIDSAIGS
jgi:hypothetical protein